MEGIDTTVTIQGTGKSFTDVQSVCVRISVLATAPNSVKAKTDAKKTMNQVYAVINRLKESGIVFKGELKSHFSIRPRFDTALSAESGLYEARFQLDVESSCLDRTMDIFDALTTLDGVRAESPLYSVDDSVREALKKRAFQSAVEDAKARFRFQAQAVGLDPDGFEIISWRTTESGHGSFSGKRLQIEGSQVTVGSSQASAEITVHLTYSPSC